jgi:hypothetical protein
MTTTTTSGRTAWRLIGGLLVVVALPYGVYSLVDVSVRRVDHVTATRSAAPSGGTALTALDVRTDGKVFVTAVDGQDVMISTRIERGLRRPRVSQRVEGDTLILRGSCPAIGSFCSVGYTVRVPRGMRVNVSSSGGSVTIDGTSSTVTASSSGGGVTLRRTTGTASASSSGGGVTIDGTSGPVTATSSGGGVRAVALRSSKVSASSSGGGVRLTFAVAPADVRAASSGGGVRVELPKGDATYAVDASASGGGTSVGVRTDPASSNRIRVRSSGGGVTVAYEGA